MLETEVAEALDSHRISEISSIWRVKAQAKNILIVVFSTLVSHRKQYMVIAVVKHTSSGLGMRMAISPDEVTSLRS